MYTMPPKSKTVQDAKQSTEPVKSEPVKPEPVKVEAPKADAEVTKTETEPEADLSSSYSEFMTKMTGLRQQMTTLITEFRALQKRSERDLKAAQKSSGKRKNKQSTRAPSGFVKPTKVSDQLADFLSKPHGVLLARTEVTREINAYIRANKLQDPSNGRKINPDDKLKKLLSLTPSDELTYFNLQKFMSQHFKKAETA
jgi:upstream activation factor subunit UAF30